MSRGKPKVAICAIAKNEGRYLEEWVVYHRMLGFGPIRVYNHESTDDTAQVLARLADAGLVEWRDWSVAPDLKPQWVAYEDGLDVLRGRADWIAFIDLDEFILMPKHRTIQALLAEHPEIDALAINWKMFGSSGHEEYEPGLVTERFTRCSKRVFRGNHAVKTLARVEAIETPRVHTCVFREGVRYTTIAGEEIPPGEGRSVEIDHETIRINHYFTRSRGEWAEKSARGRGAKPASHPKKHRTEREFAANDRNERRERDMPRVVRRLRRALDAAARDAATRQ